VIGRNLGGGSTASTTIADLFSFSIQVSDWKALGNSCGCNGIGAEGRR